MCFFSFGFCSFVFVCLLFGFFGYFILRLDFYLDNYKDGSVLIAKKMTHSLYPAACQTLGGLLKLLEFIPKAVHLCSLGTMQLYFSDKHKRCICYIIPSLEMQ